MAPLLALALLMASQDPALPSDGEGVHLQAEEEGEGPERDDEETSGASAGAMPKRDAGTPRRNIGVVAGVSLLAVHAVGGFSLVSAVMLSGLSLWAMFCTVTFGYGLYLTVLVPWVLGPIAGSLWLAGVIGVIAALLHVVLSPVAGGISGWISWAFGEQLAPGGGRALSAVMGGALWGLLVGGVAASVQVGLVCAAMFFNVLAYSVLSQAFYTSSTSPTSLIQAGFPFSLALALLVTAALLGNGLVAVGAAVAAMASGWFALDFARDRVPPRRSVKEDVPGSAGSASSLLRNETACLFAGSLCYALGEKELHPVLRSEWLMLLLLAAFPLGGMWAPDLVLGDAAPAPDTFSVFITLMELTAVAAALAMTTMIPWVGWMPAVAVLAVLLWLKPVTVLRTCDARLRSRAANQPVPPPPRIHEERETDGLPEL